MVLISDYIIFHSYKLSSHNCFCCISQYVMCCAFIFIWFETTFCLTLFYFYYFPFDFSFDLIIESSMLLGFHVFVSLLTFSRWSLVSGTGRRIFELWFPVFLNLLRFAFWPIIWSVQRSLPDYLKRLYILWCWDKCSECVCQVPLPKVWFNIKTCSVAKFTCWFCALEPLLTVEYWSPKITVWYSIYPLRSFIDYSLYFRA